MLNLKMHTPQGVTDYMPYECSAKRDIEEKMRSAFSSYAYQEIQTPAIEYNNIYTDASGDICQEKLFRFFDSEGRILALRGDITTSIARVIGSKWEEDNFPARLMYVSEAFRYNRGEQGMASEFTQAGIELVASDGAYADAEAVIVTIKALLNAGLDEFQIDIGQVEFFKGLACQIGLSKEDTEKIRELIDHKDSLSIEDILSEYETDKEIKKLLCMMPELFGDADVLERAYTKNLNDRSKKAIENLKDVYEIIKASGLSKYVSIDLGMLQSIDYYTGVIFKGVTYDVGFAICGGGRYDSLISGFGKDISAVGMAINVNRVLVAMQRQKKALKTPKVDALLCIENNYSEAVKIADMLRAKGYIIKNCYGSVEDAKNEAKISSTDCIILAETDSLVKVYQNGGEKEKSVFELLNEGI